MMKHIRLPALVIALVVVLVGWQLCHAANTVKVNPQISDTANGQIIPQTFVVTGDSLLKEVVLQFDPPANGRWLDAAVIGSGLPAGWTRTTTVLGGEEGIADPQSGRRPLKVRLLKAAGVSTSGTINVGAINVFMGACDMLTGVAFRQGSTQTFFIDSSGDTIQPVTTNSQIATAVCDYFYLDPASVVARANGTTQIDVRMTTKRHVGAWEIEVLIGAVNSPGSGRANIVGATRGADLPAGWDFYVAGSSAWDRGLVMAIGSGEEADHITGPDLHVCTLLLSTGACSSWADLTFMPSDPNRAFSGTYLSVYTDGGIHTVHLATEDCVERPWDCAIRETLYGSGGGIGAQPCPRPPCKGCTVDKASMELLYDTSKGVKQ